MVSHGFSVLSPYSLADFIVV